MANSGINLGQTGNATEAGAGIVKRATAAQVAARDADDGGVPLYVAPDRLPTPTVTSALVAAEAITAGDAVAVSLVEYADIAPPLIDQQNDTGNLSCPNTSTWYAQEFTTSADIDRMRTLVMRVQNATGVTGTSFTVRIRELANLNGGPDLFTTSSGSLNGSAVTVTFTRTDLKWVLQPSTTYVVIIHFANNGYAGANVKTDNSYQPTMYSSVDAGASWSPLVNDGFFLELIEEEVVYELNTVRLANASAFANPLNFVGFATADAAIGENVSLDFGDVVQPVGGAYTPGDTYYLSDTPGQIQNTPGTIERVVGFASDATTIIRKRGTVSNTFGQGSPTDGSPVECWFYGDAGSTTDQMTVAGVTTKGDRAMSRLVRRGETWSGGGSQRVQLVDNGSPV